MPSHAERSGWIVVFLVCLIAGYLVSQPARAQTSYPSPMVRQNVTMACNPFPPAKIANVSDRPGYDVEILRAAFEVSHIHMQTPFYPWKRAYLLAREGRVDGLCSCSYTPEREQDMIYSDELGRIRIGLFAVSDRVLKPIERLDQARGMTIGVVNGYNLEQIARAAGLDVVPVTDEQILLAMLANNRIDAIYSFRDPIVAANKARPNPLNISFHQTSEAPYFSCISRKARAAQWLIDRLNLGLQTVRANGIYDAILEKYGVANLENLKKKTLFDN